MIKFEHTLTASPEQMTFIVEGMRNPMNSWDKSDSFICTEDDISTERCNNCSAYCPSDDDALFVLGPKDLDLATRLSKGGSDDRKFLRQIPVFVRITAPLYWWKEFDTYKVGTTANSCSTMHKITEKEFTIDDFSTDQLIDICNTGLDESIPMLDLSQWGDGSNCWSPYGCLKIVINMLNICRLKYLETKDKKYWWQLIQLLPSSYNQTRNVTLNYEVLKNMYHARKAHKLDEWHFGFCEWVRTLPYFELITDEKVASE